jgi:hypothetical protein
MSSFILLFSSLILAVTLTGCESSNTVDLPALKLRFADQA